MSERWDLFLNVDGVDELGAAVEGGAFTTHGADACADEERCAIHRPSDHPLRDAPMFWDSRRHQLLRRCVHGQLHPDLDGLVHLFRVTTVWYSGKEAALRDHPCDGCCGIVGWDWLDTDS